MSKKMIYSPLKVFHHRQQIDDLRDGRRPRLIHTQLVPTNRCNQRCSFCAYRSHGYSSSQDFDMRDEIPTTKLLEIARSLAVMGVQAVEITGGGEPTLHPGFYDLCRTLQDHEIQYGVVTNGSVESSLVDSSLESAAWVRFSIDAGNSHTYAAIRRSSPETYDMVRNRITNLASRKNGREDPIIGVGFVVTRDNWREVYQAALNARDDGADNFRISAVFQNEGASYFSDFYQDVQRLCRSARTLETERFTVFDLMGDRIEDLSQKSPHYSFCGFQHLCTYVGADLGVYRCCVVAYNPMGLLGSLRDQTFCEMWHSEETAQKLRDFDAHGCPRCMFNGKNASIAYAIEKNPRHVDFL